METIDGRPKWVGHAAVLTANILWGLMAPLSKEALNYLGAVGASCMVLPTLRMLGATVLFWLLSLFTPKERVARRDLPLLLGAGLLAVAFNQNLFICGIAFTSPVDASVVATMLPVATMLLAAVVLGEPISHLKAGGVAVGMAGAALMALSGSAGLTLDANHALGDTMCFLAQCIFASYLVFCKGLIGRYSPVTLMKWMFLLSTVVVTPFSASDLMALDWLAVPTNVMLDMAYIVVCGTFVTFLILPIGQKLLRPTVVSAYNYTQPVVSTTAAVLLGLDSLGPWKAMAAALVIIGVVMVSHSRGKGDRV